MTNTIPNVPRELLERAVQIPSKASVEENHAAIVDRGRAQAEIRALLSAPPPAGVDGLEVVAFLIGGEPSLTQCMVRGVVNDPLCRLSDAQSIIDGLRGEVADLLSMLATVSKAGIRIRTERDQQAQRIGELVEVLRIAGGAIKEICTERNVPLPSSTLRRIDAALSSGK